ncbi:MAG: trypsin-like peptidase domain-containing protein [Candidatus Sumerlaeota bacterium]|nr:trypsin-like peptidase domain-containing protein [Candidatus Sumerlaeota bacterium]
MKQNILLPNRLRKQILGAIMTMSLAAFIALPATLAFAMPPIPPELKNSAVFIFYLTDGQVFKAHGTGFLVAPNAPKSSEPAACYLVTAKHVLQKEKDRLPAIFLRLNSKSGPGDTIMKHVALFFDGDRKNVFLHPDGISDVAVVRLDFQDMKKYQCVVLPSEIVINKDDVNRLQISEGTEVFFTGMFIHHQGMAHTSPILRFGHAAMMTDEKIRWADGASELYLAEVTVFGGSSGSPAFFCLDDATTSGQNKDADKDAKAEDGKAAKKETAPAIAGFKLAGIVIGAINMNTGTASDNSGITAIVPSYKIYEILNGKELKNPKP